VRQRRKPPPNDLLRAARLRIPSPSGSGRPMSRQELADAVNAHLARTDPQEANLDANHIGKLERGAHRWPNEKRRAAFRHVLRVEADRELGFYIIRSLGSGSETALATPHRIAILEDVDRTVRDEHAGGIDRRALLQKMIAGTVPGLPEGDRSFEMRHRASAIVLDGPDEGDNCISCPQPCLKLSCLRLRLDDAADEDGRNGPKAALPQVITVLRIVEERARTFDVATRRGLLTIGSRGAEFAGWLYRDAGAPGWAEYWHDRATEWALEAGDHAMPGYVLVKKSQSAWDTRDAVRMLTLAQAARQWPGHLPARVRAEAAQQEARGHAMFDGNMRAAERSLGLAQELFHGDSDANSTDANSDLATHYDRTLLTMQTAICRHEAGRPADAVNLYEQALVPNTLSRRDHAYFQTLMALALADAKQPDKAASAGISALPVAVELGSQRTIRELVRLRRHLMPWAERQAVRMFSAALAAI